MIKEAKTAKGAKFKLLSIIMPVYNEENTIKEIVKKVQKSFVGNLDKEIIIVDDGSTDSTDSIIRRDILPLYKNIKYIQHAKNRGKGMAIRTALEYTQGEIIIIQDADLEYSPSDYNNLITPILKGTAKVVYGSRYLKYHYLRSAGWIYRVGGFVITHLFNLIFFSRLTDLPTCYKVFESGLLHQLNLKCHGFDFCVEVSAKLLRLGYKIKEVPIDYSPRSVREGKKIKFIHALEAVITMLKYRFAFQNNFIRRVNRLREIVPEYHSHIPFVKRLFLRRIEEAIKIVEFKGEENILEIGVGEGKLLEFLTKKRIKDKIKGKIFGIDINPGIMSLDIKGVNIYCCDAKTTPFADNYFDIIFCLDVLEHFENFEPYLVEIKRILKPGGQLIVSLPYESIIYKLGRFLIKGTISSFSGPSSGEHFWNASEIKEYLGSIFSLQAEKDIYNRYLKFFKIVSYSLENKTNEVFKKNRV